MITAADDGLLTSHDDALALLRYAVPGARVEAVGSSYKYMRIAEGTADAAVRRSPTRLWDTAAAKIATIYGSAAGANKPELSSGKIVALSVVDSGRPGVSARPYRPTRAHPGRGAPCACRRKTRGSVRRRFHPAESLPRSLLRRLPLPLLFRVVQPLTGCRRRKIKP